MYIVYDLGKDVVNREKHGISLACAALLDWDSAVVAPDERRDYRERREIAIAYLGPRLHVIVFVDRADVRRVISLRRANKREIERYART